MVQRCKFSIELKNFPPDLSGEPLLPPVCGIVAAPYSFIIKGTELVDIINLVPFFYVKLAHNKTDV